MKKLISITSIFVLLFSGILIGGCSKNSLPEKKRYVIIQNSSFQKQSNDDNNMFVPAEGGVFFIEIETNDSWSLLGEGAWIIPSIKKGSSGFSKITFEVQPNNSEQKRKTEFRIETIDCGLNFSIQQAGIVKDEIK